MGWYFLWGPFRGGIFFGVRSKVVFFFGVGSRWGSTPRITMLANASSKLLLLLLLLHLVL
jgi:hypothetical protein